MSFSSKNNALIVIDFINDIVHKEGKIPSCADYVERYNVIENVNRAIKNARMNRHPVIHVKVGFTESYSEVFEGSPVFGAAKKHGALKLGKWGTAFHSQVDVDNSDYVVVKHRISAFYGTDLEIFLRTNKIEQVMLCGVSTNMAVELTAREAHDRDYLVEIVEDACGAHTKELHDISIKVLSSFSKIINTIEQ
ncbi:MAG: isochorismatase [Desulfobacteraceae bacterium 4572_19]|nr:MAG: isochorismatase [Desulfobacteraceae bacterium 4572_19]